GPCELRRAPRLHTRGDVAFLVVDLERRRVGYVRAGDLERLPETGIDHRVAPSATEQRARALTDVSAVHLVQSLSAVSLELDVRIGAFDVHAHDARSRTNERALSRLDHTQAANHLRFGLFHGLRECSHTTELGDLEPQDRATASGRRGVLGRG